LVLGKKAKVIPEQLLREQYVIKNKSAEVVAKEFGVGTTTVFRYLHKYNIPVKPLSAYELVPWNKGRTGVYSEETRQKIGLSHKGKPSPRKGCKATEETRRKQSEKRKGKPTWNKGISGCFSDETLQKMSQTKNGKTLTDEHKKKISQSLIGNKRSLGHSSWNAGKCGPESHRWLGGKSFEPYCFKFNEEFKESVRDAFNRRCYLCDAPENGKRLAIHHIDYNKNNLCNGQGWAFVPLCKSCHSKTNGDRWYWFSLLYNYWALNPEINF
jgi:hypothetical protein